MFGALNYFKITLLGYNFANIPVHFSFYPFIISIVVMIVVSMLTQKTDQKILDETQTGWYISKQ